MDQPTASRVQAEMHLLIKTIGCFQLHCVTLLRHSDTTAKFCDMAVNVSIITADFIVYISAHTKFLHLCTYGVISKFNTPATTIYIIQQQK